MHRVVVVVVSVLALACFGTQAATDKGDIVIGGKVPIRIRAATPEFTVEQRVLIVRRRVVEVISHEDSYHPNVRIVIEKGTPAIYVGKHLLITVHQNDAKANGTTPVRLAQRWAGNLKEALPLATPESKLPGFDPGKDIVF
ncbi:MAG: hypothetical protein ACE5R4_13265 [Armatimonadota bacterium]